MADTDTLVPQEKYVGLDGKEYKIFPMRLQDYAKVERLFSKIDDQFLFFNMPRPETDKDGKIVKKADGKIKYDYDAFNAMCDLFSMALHIPRQEILEVVDVNTGVFILDAYRGLSGLKKKIQEMQNQEVLTKLSQALSQTPPKQEKA